jgi:hypothetical protein
MNNKNLVADLFGKVVSLKARNVELGHGSFITLGFGKDIAIKVTIRREKKISNRPEWNLWVYMCAWELKMNNEIIVSSNDERENIMEALKNIENKKLLRVEVLNNTYDLQLDFENEITLCLFSNLEEDFEQWMLFTPDNKVLTAGPFETLTYESAD